MKYSGTKAFVNQVMVYSLATILTGGGVGVGTVWLRHEIAVTANRNNRLERDIAEMKRQVAAVDSDIATEQRPAALMRRNEVWHLGLMPPQEQSLVARVSENPATLLAAKRNLGLFGETASYARVVIDSDR